jgi:uncharacterized protein
MKNKKALIIFVRHPQLGKVKTRIAAKLGEQKALDIYKKLLDHTFTITSTLELTKFVFYEGQITENDLWDNCNKVLQTFTTDLGLKMHDAFNWVFNKGFNQICIIGSDCYELNQAQIENAFLALNKTDVVVGPATDGGYYLLGLQKPNKDLFTNIKWSSSTVLASTLLKAEQQKLMVTLLPTLNDVDEAEDIPLPWL